MTIAIQRNGRGPAGVPSAKTAIAAVVMGLAGLPAAAQTLKDVVVSATRAEQRSFDAPAAVQSIDSDTIRGAGAQVNLSEALNRVPGLTILNRQNYAQDLQLSIRGFGARSAFGIRGIRLLIDGIPATTPDGQGQGSSVSLTSTDRMEVLRGPLAQLYGNSSGGVIQAFTRDAPEQAEFGAQYYVGSFGMHRSDWQYAGKIGAGGIGLVADYSTFDIAGYRANSNTERKQFNGKLTFGPSEKTKVNVVFNRFDMPLAQDPLGLTAAQLAANPEQAGTNAIARQVRKIVLQNQLGATVNHSLDKDSSVTGRLYYGNRENLQYQVGVAGTATAAGGWVGLNRDYFGAGLQYNAQSRWGTTPVNWVAGVEFDRSQERRQGGAAALGQKTTTTRNEVNAADNTDFFAQGTAHLNERFSVVGGLRHSTVNMNSSDDYLVDGNGSGSISYQASNPVLGVTWHAMDSLNVFVNLGRGFESPTLAEMAYNGTGLPAFNTTLNAASSRHVEIGAKWTPTPQSRVDFTVYQIETTDEVVVASSAGGNSTFKNAPGTQRNGWELVASSLFTANLKGSLSASQIDATYSKTFTTVSGAPPAATTVLAGNKIPGIPQSSFFAELLWASQMPGARRSAVSLGSQFGLEFLQSGKIFANDTNAPAAVADGYSTWAAKASHGLAVGKGSLTVYGRVDNLTDQRYVGSVIVNQANQQFFEPAPGRNWTLGLRLVLPL
jgi:iron complex outermembrane recepter protein